MNEKKLLDTVMTLVESVSQQSHNEFRLHASPALASRSEKRQRNVGDEPESSTADV